MFKKILIANRGEIAVRIIKTARAMGIKTVAVYSEADARALHVGTADEAVEIGPAPAAASYLNIKNIVAACQATGAEAVHPGYGFLSENAAFARALDRAGIAFIGPPAKVIALMGDKIKARAFAEKAGVRVVPGGGGPVADVADALARAREIGFPVFIKAAAGGGGRGMRRVLAESELGEQFRGAVSEATSSFGDGTVFIEKFIENPRHIEIQIIADKHGHVVHLGERDCSVQRRNQKVIEEAPSVFLDAETRKEMANQAVALARAAEYDSAGTVEFIVDNNKNFYFIEMNTRLQVEHPVTEAVAGLDLVELMIRSAAGEKLPFAQSDISVQGHAIEARIYAEDPSRGFLPSIGRLTRYQPPEQTDHDAILRGDTGVYEGAEVPVHYDPMLAKLIVHARTRDKATEGMLRALDAYDIEGVRTNKAFLSALIGHAAWAAAEVTTDFIGTHFGEAFSPGLPEGELAARYAAVSAFMNFRDAARRRQEPPGLPWRRVVILGEGEEVLHFGAEITGVEGLDAETVNMTLDIHPQPGVGGGNMADTPDTLVTSLTLESAWQPGDRVWRGAIDGAAADIRQTADNGRLVLSAGAIAAPVRVCREHIALMAAKMPRKNAAGRSGRVECPMPGMVTQIAVRAGQEVRAGDVLCVIEAMKMENTLRAERDGVIAAISATVGDTLSPGDVVMTYEA